MRPPAALPAATQSSEGEVVAEAEADAEPPSSEPGFSEMLYLSLNPDVVGEVASGAYENGLAHWLAIGSRETQSGLRPRLRDAAFYAPHEAARPQPEHEAAHLDTQGYLYLNPDVRDAVGGDPEGGRRHWIDHGRFEKRRAPGIAPFRHRRIDFARMSEKPFGLNIFGPFMEQTGLGTACRNMLAAIEHSRIAYEIWNLDISQGPIRVATHDRARPAKYNTNLIFANADQMENLYAAFPEGFFNDSYTIAIWQWELAAFRPDWFSCFGAVDEVWTNSQFQESAIRSISPVPVVNIHLPVISSPVTRLLRRGDFGIPDDAFLFLLPFDVGSTIARKNPFAGVAAFKEAFKNRQDVYLIVKYRAQEHDREFGPALSKLIFDVSNIRIIAETFSHEQMVGLRAISDALISAHRSEGFGLNIGEFMALGKSVIATNYSGNTDFFDETTGYPVEYKLTEITKTTGPYPAGYVWAEPCHDSLVKNMRAVVDAPEETALRNARARQRITQEYSPSAIAWDIIRRLRKIGLDQPMPAYVRSAGRTHTVRAPSPLRPFLNGTSNPPPPLAHTPLFSVVMPVYNVEAGLLERAILSVIGQSYPFWELCIANDASTEPGTLAALNQLRGITPSIKIIDLPVNQGIAGASNAAASIATGEFLAFFDNDDELTPDALYEMAAALNRAPSLQCLYCDEIKIDKNGNEIEHFFKPDWSPEHLESVMYVLHMLVVRKSLFFESGQFRSAYDGAQDYDLMLRISRATDRICHVAKPLYRWRAIPGSAAAELGAKPYALEAGFHALTDHVRVKYHGTASVERGLIEGTFRVRTKLDAAPPVTLIILTNNTTTTLAGRGRINLVSNFVDSIQEKTSYPNYRILVIDNSSLSKGQIRRFTASGAEVVNYEFEGKFNYAAKANFAIRHCRTEFLVLLNDDMQVIAPGWLDALMEYAQKPEIGAVGGWLRHEDGSLQHAGVVLGINETVAHIYHNAAPDFVGYNGFTHIIRNYSAVTAACMATRKSVVMHAGGFDEQFSTDFNDVDLCLRIREAGYRIVYTPYCELYHFEGQSIPRTKQDDFERRLFLQRWSEVVAKDPYYNENLTKTRLDFTRA